MNGICRCFAANDPCREEMKTDRRPLFQYVLNQNISQCIYNSEVNLRGKVPVHAIKVYGCLGHTSIPPFVLKHSHFMLRETALIPTEQAASWTQSWPGCFGEDKFFASARHLTQIPQSFKLQPRHYTECAVPATFAILTTSKFRGHRLI